ncbi:Siroheme decarboxylase [Geodia barretti]|uniref:siroheme decarboxylase n=1 Tax=Geodia barretti TaxID=519541 RepID=A0AA35W347_GEOBA|nr:Siroheme decarboxylase [Geodia barretti]
MDLVDRKILNIIQTRFPLVEMPFAEIGDEVELPEEEVIERIGELKGKNVVRQISAIFDTRRLGYKTTLVAMRLPADELDAAAQIINVHPGVSHNYARNGHFNLWFTVAVPPYEDLAETVEDMASRTGAESYRLMPTIKFFKIGVNFDMVKEEGAAKKYYSPDGYDRADGQNWNKAMPITDFEIEVIRELQEDVELTPRPFSPMAERLGIPLQELFDIADSLQERSLMRRFSAVLHHRRAGFRSNAMAVWKVPSERAIEVGQHYGAVTLGYALLRAPDIPRLAIHALHDDSCHIPGYLRGCGGRTL